MVRYCIRPQAERDLDELATFIAQDKREVGLRLYEAAEETYERLARMPDRGERYPTQIDALAGVRYFPIAGFKRYLVFYLPTSAGIEIIRVLHAARDVARLL